MTTHHSSMQTSWVLMNAINYSGRLLVTVWVLVEDIVPTFEQLIDAKATELHFIFIFFVFLFVFVRFVHLWT